MCFRTAAANCYILVLTHFFHLFLKFKLRYTINLMKHLCGWIAITLTVVLMIEILVHLYKVIDEPF